MHGDLVSDLSITILFVDLDKPDTWCRILAEHRTLAIFFYVPALIQLTIEKDFAKYDMSFLKRIRTGGTLLTPTMLWI